MNEPTLRDRFALVALDRNMDAVTNGRNRGKLGSDAEALVDEVVQASWDFADRMMAEREKREAARGEP